MHIELSKLQICTSLLFLGSCGVGIEIQTEENVLRRQPPARQHLLPTRNWLWGVELYGTRVIELFCASAAAAGDTDPCLRLNISGSTSFT
jgi:hypothetical protein